VPQILRDVGLALRSMHACGSAHGDVKLANILARPLPSLRRDPTLPGELRDVHVHETLRFRFSKLRTLPNLQPRDRAPGS
jgi:serine/threonine protein kinase